eukprot:CAMPEP_0184495232 /NCGR_PEP_ID=MMETSP0113_2-20130426/30731_1 /TAXON_ID=91329 /ORGANISM="Norrisiella sphaerica, Strain BC52" /LENGTH=352 /DNA_ID=CAMNT_0026881329 /DNA_START=1 /DNA_END=1059 /DNA_ORIENTATION=-
MAVSPAVGYIVAVLSAVFNGSFPAAFKIPMVARCDLHPMLFQLYVSFGVFLSSWLVLPFMEFNGTLTGADGKHTPAFPFPYLGVIAGMIFVLSVVFSFAAIPFIGLAMAQGVWGGSAILVAFIWGVAVFGNPIINPGLAAAAIILLLTGVCGIAFCDTIAQRFVKNGATGQTYQNMLNMENGDGGANEGTPLSSEEGNKVLSRWLTGVAFALCVGLAGGSTLVPLNYVPSNLGGLAFVPAFGCGAMFFSPIIALAWFSYQGTVPALHLKQTLWAGILSGVLWNLSNVCAIIAIPALSYSVAYPMLQCALFVAGLWGVFVFHEIQGLAIGVFFIAGACLITGAVCLALSEIHL